MLIEAKSVLENYDKMKSAAAAIPDEISRIVMARTKDEAKEIIELIRESAKKDNSNE